MSYNVNELDNELKMYLGRDLQGAEEWRQSQAARPARAGVTSGKLLSLARAAASRAIAAAGQGVGSVQAWIAGSSEPQEECC